VRIDAVISQWNFGFFGPRGLGVTVQYTNSISAAAPSPTAARRASGNVLQKPQPPTSLGETLLHQAVGRGSKSKVREALEHGDHLEALNRKGESPLYRAVARGDKSIVQILLDKGASPVSRPLGEYTPLQLAASRDRKGILKLLVEKCSAHEIEEVTPAGETALYLTVQKQYNGCIQVCTLRLTIHVDTGFRAQGKIIHHPKPI